jgi:hypothetical protein
MARIYVMRRGDAIVVSRRRPGMLRARPVPRSWSTLAEIPPRVGRPPGDTALVFAPPVALGALAAALAPAGVGVAVGGAALIASTRLVPVLRRRLADRRLRRPENIVLHGDRARSAFDRTVALADRISDTWPGLGPLVNVDEASELLAEALWQIAAVLARREELDAALAADPPVTGSLDADPLAAGEGSVEVRSQVSAAKAARARVEADFVRREASLRRAEEAGRDFIREQHMREAIRSAEQTLGSVPPAAGLSSAGFMPGNLTSADLSSADLSSAPLSPPVLPSPVLPLNGRSANGLPGVAAIGAGVGASALDAGADLADHTRSVLAAYRELTVGVTAD